ncbi:MAG: hybrid sensor histidine kinase/response regulator [Lachnospiraceae bacterium]
MSDLLSQNRIAAYVSSETGLFQADLAARLVRRDFSSLWVIDPESGVALDLFSYADPALRASTDGFYYERVMRDAISENCVDESPRTVLDALSLGTIVRKLKEGKDCYRVCFRMKTGEGEVRDYEAFYYSVGKDGLIFMIRRDMTESFAIHDSQNAAKQEKLESFRQQNAKTSDFLEMMRKDQRSPLQSIQNVMGQDREKMSEDGHANISAVDGYLRKISMSGTYMGDVIDDILQILHRENNPPRLQPRAVNLRRFLIRIEESILFRLQEKNLHFLLDASKLSVNVVITDSTWLQECLEKLIELVISQTVEGGTVELHAEGESGDGQSADIVFSALGRGTVPDAEKHVRQFSDSMKPLSEIMQNDPDAWDLGLNLLQYYTKVMGGSLSVENYPDLGIRFSVRFSLQLPEEKEMNFIMEQNPYEGKKILIADDNKINRELISRLLHREGCEVLQAENGAEAFDLYRKNAESIDMIMLDIRMPVMDGLECTRKIRSSGLPGCESIPVIALTVCAYESDIEKSFDAGMNEHLIKPVEPEKLYKVMSHYLKAE